MKKFLAVIMIAAIIFTFSACSSKEYEDTVVTIPVTDENGEAVTDENGEAVTETVKSTEQDADAQDGETTDGETTEKASGSKTTAKSSGSKTTKKSGSSTTTKKNSSKTTSSANSGTGSTASSGTATQQTTAKSTTSKTTTTEATTEKHKKREVSVTVKLPFYNKQTTQLSIRYKVDDDKTYTYLEFEDPTDKKKKVTYDTVTLDGETEKTYELGKLKGDVTVVIEMTDVKITGNGDTVTIPYNESSATLKPYMGIEILQGEDF